MKSIIKLLLFSSAILLIAGIIIYFVSTTLVPTIDTPASVTKTEWGDKKTILYYVSPTSSTKPNTTYSILIDNTLFIQEFDISWNQLELNINKSKVLKGELTPDEIVALLQHQAYDVIIYTVEHTHPITWIVLPLIIFVIFIYLHYSKKSPEKYPEDTKWVIHQPIKSNQYSYNNANMKDTISKEPMQQPLPPIKESLQPPPPPKGDIISKLINNVLYSMDATAKWYANEDEANRELVSCLNSILSQAHINDTAIYHYYLGNGRTIDAILKNSNKLIEGKLNPSQSEIDRLLGQLPDYAKYSDEIHIVIYGSLNDNIKQRILNEIKSRYYNHVFLDYLEGAKRQRQSTERININAPYKEQGEG